MSSSQTASDSEAAARCELMEPLGDAIEVDV
jgi:hypothetical protein